MSTQGNEINLKLFYTELYSKGLQNWLKYVRFCNDISREIVTRIVKKSN